MSVVPSATTPIGMLGPQNWIDDKATQKIFKALQADGTQARFVGGCVRDALAKKTVSDIDIATPDQPDIVTTLLENDGIRVIPTGIKHGTVTAIIDDQSFEITTLRRDVETDGRHATVSFTDDWLEDAKRRDFSINAMSANLNGDVFDPFNGIHDLAHGWIKFIGLAHERIEEDVLRILRYYRFYGSHGRPPMNRDALAACRAGAHKLDTLSGERILSELIKILLCPDPANVCMIMRSEHIFEAFLPEVKNIGTLRVLTWLETQAFPDSFIKPNAFRRFAALLDMDREDVKSIAQKLRLSNDEAGQLAILCDSSHKLTPYMNEAAELKILRKVGPERVTDLILLTWARDASLNPNLPSDEKQGWSEFLERCKDWNRPELPISGKDVQDLGIPEGALIGKLLSTIETWWEDHSCKPSRQDCLETLHRRVREL